MQHFGLKGCKWTAEATADGDIVLTTAHRVKFALAGKITPTLRAAQCVREDGLPGKQVSEGKEKTEQDSHPGERLKKRTGSKHRAETQQILSKGTIETPLRKRLD